MPSAWPTKSVVQQPGGVLLEFLRNGGKLQRRGDDKDMLRLAQRLRDWVGLEASPFHFTASRTLWSTDFECSSGRLRRATN